MRAQNEHPVESVRAPVVYGALRLHGPCQACVERRDCVCSNFRARACIVASRKTARGIGSDRLPSGYSIAHLPGRE